MPRLVNRQALSYDDVLLVPQENKVLSRLDTNLETKLTKNIKLRIPICSAPMSSITEDDMMIELNRFGGAGMLHRFHPPEKLVEILDSLPRIIGKVSPIIASIGCKEEDYELLERLIGEPRNPPDVINVDVAHADFEPCIKMVQFIKSRYPYLEVIAGTIATSLAARRLADAGADGLRVGIGGGSMCITRKVTGHGIPTLQSVMNCGAAVGHYGIPIIADGGIRNSGDIVKALAFGASAVTLGGLLSGSSKTPGPILNYDGKRFKEYYGMSSAEAQKRRVGMKTGIASEGLYAPVEYKGETSNILQELLGGIRSGLTYSGARNIEELRPRAEYVILAPGAIKESKL